MKLGECTALRGECERVAGCICVSEKMPGEEVKAANVHAGVCTIARVKYRVYRRGGRT